jgi:hypothetical protein
MAEIDLRGVRCAGRPRRTAVPIDAVADGDQPEIEVDDRPFRAPSSILEAAEIDGRRQGLRERGERNAIRARHGVGSAHLTSAPTPIAYWIMRHKILSVVLDGTTKG